MGCGAAVGSPGHHRHWHHQHHDGDPDQVDEEDGEGYIVAGSVCVTDEGSGCCVLNALTHSTHRCKVSLLKTFPLFLFQALASLTGSLCCGGRWLSDRSALAEFGRFAEESFD